MNPDNKKMIFALFADKQNKFYKKPDYESISSGVQLNEKEQASTSNDVRNCSDLANPNIKSFLRGRIVACKIFGRGFSGDFLNGRKKCGP